MSSINLIDEQNTNEFRHWESGDFSVSKLVRVEGDMNLNPPRLGCCGQFEVEESSISLTGFEWDQIQSNQKLSRYYNKECLVEKESASGKNPRMVGNFRIGLGDTDLDRSLEETLRTMYPGEKSEVSVRLNLDMTKRQHLVELLESKSEETAFNHWVTLQITLKLRQEGYHNRPAIYNWHYMEKTKEAHKVYLSAVKLFQGHRYYDAFLFFRQALSLTYIALNEVEAKNISKMDNAESQIHIKQESNEGEAYYDETQLLREKCISNITACHFQWSNYQHVICLANERLSAAAAEVAEKSFDKALKVKTLYRRGVSHAELNNYEEALTDLNSVLVLEPTNKAATQRLKVVKINRQKTDMQMSKGMKKMFQSSSIPQ